MVAGTAGTAGADSRVGVFWCAVPCWEPSGAWFLLVVCHYILGLLTDKDARGRSHILNILNCAIGICFVV